MKQLSVFLENRAGRLLEALSILSGEKINVLSLSLAETSEYGMLRLLVSDPEAGQRALSAHGMSSTVTNILTVKMPHQPGSLRELLVKVCEAGLNIEYMYGLCTSASEAVLALKVSDLEKGEEIIRQANLELWTGEES